jgi:hypothetical protein
MTLSNEYITPQFAAETLYEFVRKPWTHAFTRMGMSMSSRSFDKPRQSLTCTQTCRIEFETFEPYQAHVIRIDVDLCGKEGQVTVHGAGIHSQYVFPSDADTLELWLIQFRCFLRKEFSKDKNNND